ncbi:MAG TPA: PCI domain-containing protein [Thermoplasmata archaeon]
MKVRPKHAYFLVGIGGVVTAGILAVVGFFAAASGGTVAGLAPAAGLCAGVAFVPGILFAWLYWGAERRDRGLAQVGALLESYGEVSVKAMAEKLGTTEDDAEQLIALSIREGHARGRIDPKDRAFHRHGEE